MATARRDKTYDLSIVLAVLANVDTLFCLDQYFCSLRQKSLEGASISVHDVALKSVGHRV